MIKCLVSFKSHRYKNICVRIQVASNDIDDSLWYAVSHEDSTAASNIVLGAPPNVLAVASLALNAADLLESNREFYLIMAS